MENRIKVFIIDDHLMVRMGLGIMIDELQDLEKVGEAENGEATLRLLQKVTPDVILMDVRMPDINGMELSKTILAKYPEMKILLMTAFTEYLSAPKAHDAVARAWQESKAWSPGSTARATNAPAQR